MFHVRFIKLVLAVLLLTGTSALALPAVMAEADTDMASIYFQAEDIAEVHMSHSDMVYVPLFGSREADRASIEKVAVIISRMMSEAKPDTESATLDGLDIFFMTKINVALADGGTFGILIGGADKLYFDYAGDSYMAKDAAAVKELNGLLIAPGQTSYSTTKPQIGQPVHIQGNDAPSEQGTIRIFINENGSFSGLTSERGVYYPSRQALLIYEAPVTQGRYDFTFTMPAYGKAFDGSFKPVSLGKSTLYYDTGGLAGMKEMTVTAPAQPQLSINGVPVTSIGLQPVIQSGVMLLPMRALANALGWPVTWDAAHKAALLGAVRPSGSAPAAGGGSLSVWVNGKQLTGAGAKPVLIHNAVYLPVRATATAFGSTVDWSQMVRSANLTVKPLLLAPEKYTADSRKLAAVKGINDYVLAMNNRDMATLKKLYAKDRLIWSPLEGIGQQIITGVKNVSFQDRPGGGLLANVTFTYLFEPNGQQLGSRGIVFLQENGAWKIADVD